MTRHEDEPKQIVAHIVVDRCIEIDSVRITQRFELSPNVVLLALDNVAMTHRIDRSAFCGRHEPCASIVRNSRSRPLLQRGYERVLREILGEPHVAYDAHEAGYELCGFDSPDCLDRTMRSRLRHTYKSAHARQVVQVVTRHSRPPRVRGGDVL